jgi:tetratricopeptide (TPR) repeat protein
MPPTASTKTFWAAILIVLLLVFWVYQPGLQGGFLFDDFATLPNLGKYGPVDNWTTFWRYITSGKGDPAGRPLAMLSFLANAHDWPAAPLPFKSTNLLIHLANGLLLIRLLRKLGRIVFNDASITRVDFAAVLCGAFWLLQPLFVSTTLYVVQRETLLSASFVLLGLLAWLHGRDLLLRGHDFRAHMGIVLGLGLCSLLALLCKANGILLPILALVIEHVLLRAHAPIVASHSSTQYRKALLILAWAPSVLIVAYLIYQGWLGVTRNIFLVRPWSLGQRLITEPRVLVNYLQQLWIPRPFTAGVFNDQIRASTSLWSPLSTFPAVLAVLMLITGAVMLRRRCPALALAILFYFAGHLLESTTIPLELYFEHRNYIPAMMMYWPLALWLCSVPTRRITFSIAGLSGSTTATPSHLLRIGKPTFAVAILLGLALMTHAGARLWGDSRDQAILWAMLNPESPRAQANAAIVEINSGHPELAAQRLRSALARAPHEAQLSLNLFHAECLLGHVDGSTIDAASASLRSTRDTGPLLLNWFNVEIAEIQQSPCPELNTQTLHNLLSAALSNPRLMAIYGRRQDMYHLEGQLALEKEDADTALAYFNQALDQEVEPQTALKQAALLGSKGYPRQGLAHLDHYEATKDLAPKAGFDMQKIHTWLLQRQHYWPKELARLRATLSEDAANRSNRLR